MPVLYAASGNCHVYVDAAADLDKAAAIAVNAKVQRPGVCNAAETLLVHADVAGEFLPRALAELRERGVELRGRRTHALAGGALADSLDRRDRGGLGDRVPRADPGGEGGRFGRGGDRAREPLQERALGGDRHRLHEAARRFTDDGRHRLRVRERVDALHRRRAVRHGRRDRQLHAEASRARPDRPARALHVQVRGRGRRADPRVGAALRIGIFGGAFNPPHLGPPRLRAGGVRPAGLDVVVWVPIGAPPHREIEEDPGADVRLQMRATPPRDERFGLSRIEIDRDGRVVHGRTRCARAAERSPDDELVLILGGDQAAALADVARAGRGAALATVAVAERGEDRAAGVSSGSAQGAADGRRSSRCHGSTCHPPR